MFFRLVACDFSVYNVIPLLRDIGISKFPDALMQKDQEAHPPAVMPKNIFPAMPSCETIERRINSEEAVGLIWIFTIYCIFLILISLWIAAQYPLPIPVQIIPKNVCLLSLRILSPRCPRRQYWPAQLPPCQGGFFRALRGVHKSGAQSPPKLFNAGCQPSSNRSMTWQQIRHNSTLNKMTDE